MLELNPADLAEQNQNAIDGMLRQIAEAMGKEGSEEDIAYYRLNLGFEVDEDYKAKYKEAVQNSVGQFKESQSNMEEIFTELGIDTSGEIDRWNKIAESADSAAEAKQKYMEARLGGIEPSSFSPETLSKAMKSLLPSVPLSGFLPGYGRRSQLYFQYFRYRKPAEGIRRNLLLIR